jgi:hypothetical protein
MAGAHEAQVACTATVSTRVLQRSATRPCSLNPDPDDARHSPSTRRSSVFAGIRATVLVPVCRLIDVGQIGQLQQAAQILGADAQPAGHRVSTETGQDSRPIADFAIYAKPRIEKPPRLMNTAAATSRPY